MPKNDVGCYAIRFEFPEDGVVCYAGETREGLGIAPTIKTAAFFATREIAERFARNHYGGKFANAATVIEIEDRI